MRVLVTGHAGYLGGLLMPMLAARGHDIAGCDAGLFDRCTFGDPPPPVAELGVDVRDIEARHLEGFDAVIHLAGLSNDPLGNFRPELTEEINQLAAIRVATLARRVGVQRFLFASSCSNYGASSGEELLDETAAFNPVTAYGRSKAAAESVISALADDAFSPVQLRAGTVYGLAPRIRFDLVLNNLVAWATATGRIHLKSDGSAWRPLVHASDVARAYVAALEAPREAVHDQAFNVGRSDQNFTIRQLASMIEAALPGARIEFAGGAGPDTRNYRVSCDKIARLLPAYRPLWTVAEGIRELVEGFRDRGLDVETFEGHRFNRLAHLRWLIDRGLLDRELRWRDAA
jgi:nucleoside-diphosphate-sugar epimerase